MVTNYRLSHLLAAGVATLALAGCASSGLAAGGSTSTVGSLPASSTPIPQPMNPFLSCAAISGLAAATKLVDDGRTTLVVTARIARQPTRETELTSVVPVVSYSVVAGGEGNGPVKYVEFDAAPGANLLPPGSYLLALGASSTPSRYFLSNGLSGSFVLDGGHAYRRCPNLSDPSRPRAMQAGVTEVTRLADLFNQAIETGDSSSSNALRQP
jgi:hypothetical protein